MGPTLWSIWMTIGAVGSCSLNTETDRSTCFRVLDAAWVQLGPFRVTHLCEDEGWGLFVEEWCEARNVEQLRYPPDVSPGCGLELATMLAAEGIAKESDLILAGWDGESFETMHTMRHAAKLGKPVHDVLAAEQGRAPWTLSGA